MGTCESCPSNCKACTGSDDCSTCDAGFTKGKWGSCECGNGTYLNSTSKVLLLPLKTLKFKFRNANLAQ